MLRSLVILLLIMSFASCMVILPVETNVDDEFVEFSLNKEGIFTKTNRAISYVIIEEYSNDYAVKAKSYWEIESINASMRLEFISYGIVPDGFKELTKSIKLVAGIKYRVDIVGPGYTSSGTFMVE